MHAKKHTVPHNHVGAQLVRAHGPLIRYSSWVLESANKVWKDLLLRYSNNKSEDHAAVAKQALTRMLRITDPRTREESQKDVRVRDEYMCGRCGKVKTKGHTRDECLGGPVD